MHLHLRFCVVISVCLSFFCLKFLGVNGVGGLPTPRESPVPDGNLSADIDECVPDASNWSPEDVQIYFQEHGFKEQALVFRDQVQLQIIVVLKYIPDHQVNFKGFKVSYAPRICFHVHLTFLLHKPQASSKKLEKRKVKMLKTN